MEKEMALVLIGLVLFIILLFVPAYFSDVISCQQKSVSFESHKYGFFSGCMVKHNDRWLPLENIRGFDDKG
jgi:hypothetical protein